MSSSGSRNRLRLPLVATALLLGIVAARVCQHGRGAAPVPGAGRIARRRHGGVSGATPWRARRWRSRALRTGRRRRSVRLRLQRVRAVRVRPARRGGAAQRRRSSSAPGTTSSPDRVRARRSGVLHDRAPRRVARRHSGGPRPVRSRAQRAWQWCGSSRSTRHTGPNDTLARGAWGPSEPARGRVQAARCSPVRTRRREVSARNWRT